jgi:DNA-binding XRE family transcriptional regulator
MEIDTTTIRDNSFALAIEVIRERIRRLPEDDARDLHDLLPALFSCDEEEVESAAVAIQEILSACQEPRSVGAFAVESGVGPLEKWVQHASERIRELRKAKKMTQETLADKTGIPQSYISRLENGEHSPTAMTIRKIAEALGVPAKEIDPSAE